MSKNVILQSGSHITVKKVVVHRSTISLAQAIYVHNDDMPLPEIVHCNNLASGCQPRKKKKTALERA
jgi:hypothetical protein